MSHLLVTTDLSKLAQVAYPAARRLAAALDLSIRLVHVIDVGSTDSAGRLGDDAWLRGLRERVDARLARDAAVLGVGTDTRHRVGHPVLEILKALDDGAALLVIATHGYGGAKRLLVGSTTARLVRSSPVPVVAVPPGAAGKAAFQKILVPTGGGRGMRELFPAALDIARHLEARIDLLHVLVPPQEHVVFADTLDADQLGERTRRQRDRAEQHLVNLVAAAQEARITCGHALVEAPRAAPAICERATAIGADLIAMPAHGLRGLSRLMLGSVTEEVIQLSPVPVLVLKPDLPA